MGGYIQAWQSNDPAEYSIVRLDKHGQSYEFIEWWMEDEQRV